MFWKIFLEMCAAQGESPNGVAKKIGIASCSVTQWKNGGTPRDSTLLKIAKYFGVSKDYLLGLEEKEKPTLAGELSEAEKMILDLFRQIPPEQQEMVLKMIEAALRSR